jgi:hypothetical protein
MTTLTLRATIIGVSSNACAMHAQAVARYLRQGVPRSLLSH